MSSGVAAPDAQEDVVRTQTAADEKTFVLGLHDVGIPGLRGYEGRSVAV